MLYEKIVFEKNLFLYETHTVLNTCIRLRLIRFIFTAKSNYIFDATRSPILLKYNLFLENREWWWCDCFSNATFLSPPFGKKSFNSLRPNTRNNGGERVKK